MKSRYFGCWFKTCSCSCSRISSSSESKKTKILFKTRLSVKRRRRKQVKKFNLTHLKKVLVVEVFVFGSTFTHFHCMKRYRIGTRTFFIIFIILLLFFSKEHRISIMSSGAQPWWWWFQNKRKKSQIGIQPYSKISLPKPKPNIFLEIFKFLSFNIFNSISEIGIISTVTGVLGFWNFIYHQPFKICLKFYNEIVKLQ